MSPDPARTLISVVIPFFDERENLERIHAELSAVRDGALSGYDFEVLLLDNHSSDGSFEVASAIAARDPAVRVIRLSRNFGYQANILTGILHSSGDAVVQLDADGEDDPALIVEFVQHWRSGKQVVYGVRRSRRESFVLTFQRRIFYRLLSALSPLPIPNDAGDFRLLDRRVVEFLRSCGESNPYLRGLIAYAGFNQVGVPYDRRARWKGESKFTWWRYLELAWDGITSFSRRPLQLASWLGVSLSALSFLGTIFYLWLHFFVGTHLPGFTTLILAQLFLAGVQLLSMGVLGTYVGRIFDEVKRRPRSVIEARVGGDAQPTRGEDTPGG